MKLSHKLVMVSAAALMGVSPVIGAVQNTTVMAATTKKKAADKSTKKVEKTTKKTTKTTSAKTTKKSSKKTTSSKKTSTAPKADVIVLARNSYVYDQNSKRNKNYKFNGESWPVIGKGASLKVNGTKTIDGKLYYSIGGNNYIKAVNVATFNGKKVNTTTSSTSSNTKKIKLTHNAYVYNKNGKRIKSAGTLAKNSTIRFYSTKKIKGKSYFYLGKGQYVKTANAKKVEKDDEPKVEDTIITLVKNSIVYDGEGNPYTPEQKYSRGGQYIALNAKQIAGKWYYQIGNDDGDGEWIKAVNAVVSQGPALIKDPDYVEPSVNTPSTDVNEDATIITLKRDTYTYNNKGIQSTSNKFAAGHKLRVTELTWIWVPAQKQAYEFYRLTSDPSGYIKMEDVDTVVGKQLITTNTDQEAQEAGVVANNNDKSALNTAINGSSAVVNSDKYKLSSTTLRDAYDTALVNAKSVVNSNTSTILSVNTALSDLNKAQNALNGAKIKVSSLSNISSNEASAIINLVASVTGVSQSSIQFTNGNTQLVIVGANNYTKTVPVSDYASVE
ncbi:SLAP domain-containing protein [Lactobacillus hamsteri]|uniref:Cell separation protein n=1 Tax=Lactobacillus hamsteri DSM 5661 = JCM 6256 TaxID=1423754 RepID=A0A0R1YM53_9LACO|nr:SLAP domain-containing protein [Lactobacillus hamsteri]KRM41051.1 cell separation protein [Lactobacillus hamsteri DSM 5661 = JCM 6256]